MAWERELEKLLRGDLRAVLVAGGIGSGKTRAAAGAARFLRDGGHPVGGVISPRILLRGVTVGYRVRDLSTGRERDLCSLEPPGIRFRRFYFSPEGLEFARRAIARAAEDARVVIVDEVGPWELRGGGFAPALERAVGAGKALLLTVRPHLVEEVRAWVGPRGVRVLWLNPPRRPRPGSPP